MAIMEFDMELWKILSFSLCSRNYTRAKYADYYSVIKQTFSPVSFSEHYFITHTFPL